MTRKKPVEASPVEESPEVDLPRLVLEFCAGQKWAVQGWKDQAHIKPLFDFAAAFEKTQRTTAESGIS